jgi:dihydroflavonol-4-reductase
MIFVTGAGGLLGSHIAYELLRQGFAVKCLTRSPASENQVLRVFQWLDKSRGNDYFGQIQWVTGDLLDPESIESALEGCDTVIHAAGVVSYHRRDRAMMYRVNVEATGYLLEISARVGIRRFAHVSSIAALGSTRQGRPVNELDHWNASDYHTHYGISKHLAELEVFRAVEEGLSAFIINPGVVIGAGEPGRSSNALVSILDRGLPFCSAGNTGVTGARDVATQLAHLLNSASPGERYICVSENLSYCELCRKICNALGKKAPQRMAPPWLLRLAVAAHWVREKITGKKAVITGESVSNTSLDIQYDSSKLIRTTGIPLAPLDLSIGEAASFHRAVAAGQFD